MEWWYQNGLLQICQRFSWFSVGVFHQKNQKIRLSCGCLFLVNEQFCSDHRASSAQEAAKHNKIMLTRKKGYQPQYHVTCTICDWYLAYFSPPFVVLILSDHYKFSSFTWKGTRLFTILMSFWLHTCSRKLSWLQCGKSLFHYILHPVYIDYNILHR